ncbi:helix-turn-helix domain-containing protein [Yoonia sp. SS1-5]|uniref:Helix-turn-helix domain-containing protein n=1 Tax=Yoonia rhodophyticola TaxID=3137370 RepID=A0AAN0M6Q5_9RHOB
MSQPNVGSTRKTDPTTRWFFDTLEIAVRDRQASPSSVFGALARGAVRPERSSSYPPCKREFGSHYRAAIAYFQDEFFGLPGTRNVPNGSFRVLCQCALSGGSVRQGLTRAIRFLSIIKGIERSPVVHEGDRLIRFQLPPDPNTCDDVGYLANFGMLIWCRFASWLANTELPIVRLELVGLRDVHAVISPLVTAEHIVFESKCAAVTYRVKDLERVSSQAENTITDLIANYPLSLLRLQLEPGDTAAAVRHILARHAGSSPLTTTAISTELNTSVSTLHRRLSSQGTSVQQIKDELRTQSACVLLQEARLDLMEIAEKCGFSEVSSFHRSFRRWTGMTPVQYRQKMTLAPPEISPARYPQV